MANMKHKSIEQRRTRRRRFIEPVNHFRKKYNCTAMQVPKMIEAEFSQLNKKIDKRDEQIILLTNTFITFLETLPDSEEKLKLQEMLNGYVISN